MFQSEYNFLLDFSKIHIAEYVKNGKILIDLKLLFYYFIAVVHGDMGCRAFLPGR